MTGYGTGTAGRGNDKAQITVRSLIPGIWRLVLGGIHLDPKIESEINDLIESAFERGSAKATIENKNFENNKTVFNKKRFETIKDTLKNIHVLYGQRLNLSDIISTNDILLTEENNSSDENIKSLEKALNELKVMSEIEGKNIYLDLVERIKYLNELVSEVDQLLKYRKEKQASLKKKFLNCLIH